MAKQLSVAEGRVDRHAIDWIRNWKEEGQGVVLCARVFERLLQRKLGAIWEKLVDRKYFKTSEGLKLKDVGNIWRNVIKKL